MQSKIMCFRDSQEGWIVIWESSQELQVLTVFLTGAR